MLPRTTVFMGVPTYYVRLLAEPGFTRELCANVRLFVSGSAPLLKETFDEFKARTGHTILERYGMTVPDMFHAPEKLREVLASRTLPSDLQTRFSEAKTALERSLAAVRAAESNDAVPGGKRRCAGDTGDASVSAQAGSGPGGAASAHMGPGAVGGPGAQHSLAL